jgi:hypothetical protein
MAVLLLLLPLVAMQFTDEVAWDETDFLVFGAMLFSACGSLRNRSTDDWECSLPSRRWNRNGCSIPPHLDKPRGWHIGSEDNPANLPYGGVLFLGLICSFVARFEPRGMAWTCNTNDHRGGRFLLCCVLESRIFADIVGLASNVNLVQPAPASALQPHPGHLHLRSTPQRCRSY